MVEKILEKQLLRYVIATTISGRPMYLKKALRKAEYKFVTDINEATKCVSVKIANTVREFYIYDTHDIYADLIIIPLVISYELVKED